jgi:CRP/FNR family transcriptional regulator
MIKYLKKSKLFSGFDDASLETMLTAVSVKTVSKGEIIFYEKDPAPAFFVVGIGKVKIIKISPDGKEQILMIASDGDSFAEAALFGGGKYPATAQAMTDGKLLVIHRDRFISIIERNPSIALNLIARLSELLHKLNKLVEELSLTDINTRLAHYFINIIEENNLAENDPILITLSEKKTILASQLGTIPETLSRSFKKLSKENVITVNSAEVTIVDLEKLYKFAGE